jgi:hypothetical protein
MPSFGPKGRPARTPVLEDFDFTILRDDEPETHHFQARVVSDVATLMVTLTNTEKHPERSMSGLMLMIAKMLYNKDGVPARWTPEPLPAPEDDPDAEPMIRDPLNGELIPASAENINRLTAFEAGSSRRRWLYLMNEDDEAIVQQDDLMELFRWLVGLAAKRPT